jgi:hypothetical protein
MVSRGDRRPELKKEARESPVAGLKLDTISNPCWCSSMARGVHLYFSSPDVLAERTQPYSGEEILHPVLIVQIREQYPVSG